MDTARAKEIYESNQTVTVKLDGNGDNVWIENIDEANGMATVMVGGNPTNTQTVSCDRLKEESK